MELIMRDFKSKVVLKDEEVDFSFTLEDNGPGVAWPDGKAAVIAVTEVKNIQGQLLVKGTIKPPVVPEPEPVVTEEIPASVPVVQEPKV